MSFINVEECKAWLKNELSEERYEHSLGTAECAKELAELFGEDSEKAYLCGLVHDCAKCLPESEMRKIAEPYIVDMCQGEWENFKAIHALSGAIILRDRYDLDSEFIDAVRWHTLGTMEMTRFQKIIFLADKMESRTRPNELIEPLKKVLKEDQGLDKALLICYKNTIKSLVDRNLGICPNTIDVYNELLNKLHPKEGK